MKHTFIGDSDGYFLKPCPFCGGKADFVRSWLPSREYSVTCTAVDDCMGINSEQDEQGGFDCEFKTKQEAADAWNTRADVNGWQPIETAPKDGEVILLVEDGDVTAGMWCVYGCDGLWMDTRGIGHEFDVWGKGEIRNPTHWMPLPKVPEEQP